MDASFPRPTRRRFLLLYGRFRPQVAIDPRTFDLKLSFAVILPRERPPQPSNSPLDPRSAIDFALLFPCVLCSHVARRRPASAHRRHRARPRRVGGAHDFQLGGTAACRHAGPSSCSPVPVPGAHGALGMCLDDMPPTLVPRPYHGCGTHWRRLLACIEFTHLFLIILTYTQPSSWGCAGVGTGTKLKPKP